MKFTEPIMLKIELDYSVFEKTVDEDFSNSDVPSDPRFGRGIPMDENDPRFGTVSGGKMDWFLLKHSENLKESPEMKIQLMRIWVTQMYTQMAAGLSFTNEMESTIKTDLTEEELDFLAKINTKIVSGIYNEMSDLDGSFMRKKKIKKIDI